MRFSIIIPTFNRPGRLDQCLTAIGALDYPPTNFEVLVMDDGSEPPPDEVIARHTAVLPLRYFRHTRQGPARSRNCGLRHAQGEYVVFTDDDCTPDREWLNALDRAFTQHSGAGLGGRIINAPDDRIFGVTSQLLVTFLYEYAESNTGNLRFFCSNNLAFRRGELLEVGGFEEAFPLAAAEDRDICARWLGRGQLCFVPEAVVQHSQDLDALSFCAQHYRYGRGAFQFWSLRSRGRAKRRLESWRFYYRMLTFPFSRASFPRALVQAGLLALSQAACAAGYFAEGWRSRRHRGS